MRVLILAIALFSIAFAQPDIFGPGGMPTVWEDLVKVSSDTLTTSWLTSPSATSGLYLSGDTLFLTRTGAAGDHDQLICIVDESGNKYCFGLDDGNSRIAVDGDFDVNGIAFADDISVDGGRFSTARVSDVFSLLLSSAVATFVVDVNSAGSGLFQAGETGDGDTFWVNSLGRLEGSVVDSTYTAGATEEIWVEQTAADTVYLPASPTAGDWFKIKFTNASGGVLAGNGNTIDGSATAATTEDDALEVLFNGTEWGIW